MEVFKIAYSPTYTADDADDITIDLLGTIIVVMVGFGSLIGLVLLYRWFKGKKAF